MDLAGSAQSVELAALAGSPEILGRLFDAFDDVVFFVKDRGGRYRLVNQTLVRRLGMRHKEQLLGRRADELFPVGLGAGFRRQDERVLDTAVTLRDRLELHLYPDGSRGWCRTFKMPLVVETRVVGLVGFSKDLQLAASALAPDGVAQAAAYVEEHLHESLGVRRLAEVAGMRVRTFERAVQHFLGLSAGELVIKARVDRACRLLAETRHAVAFIAQECGYSDHSAFTRQFRSRVGLTPTGFRALRGRSDAS
ncbi:MAG: AraC family transcriptional regulator [Acidobacteriota bacterium]